MIDSQIEEFSRHYIGEMSHLRYFVMSLCLKGDISEGVAAAILFGGNRFDLREAMAIRYGENWRDASDCTEYQVYVLLRSGDMWLTANRSSESTNKIYFDKLMELEEKYGNQFIPYRTE